MSRLLVDTEALLWWLIDDPALSPAGRAAIADPTNEPLVSAASIWEIAIKRSLGKLMAPDDLPDIILAEGFTLLAIDAQAAWNVRALPHHHRDPFDRLLIAQALSQQLPVVSADARFAAYGIDVHW
jgi:PIN domain nuclease of toxin-antitoxin system